MWRCEKRLIGFYLLQQLYGLPLVACKEENDSFVGKDGGRFRVQCGGLVDLASSLAEFSNRHQDRRVPVVRGCVPWIQGNGARKFAARVTNIPLLIEIVKGKCSMGGPKGSFREIARLAEAAALPYASLNDITVYSHIRL